MCLFDVQPSCGFSFLIGLCNGLTSSSLSFVYRTPCRLCCSLMYSPRYCQHCQPMWATLSTVVLSTSTPLPHLGFGSSPLGFVIKWDFSEYVIILVLFNPLPLSHWMCELKPLTLTPPITWQRAWFALYYMCTKEFQSVEQNVDSALVVSKLGSACHSMVSFGSFALLPTLNLSLSSQPLEPRPTCLLSTPTYHYFFPAQSWPAVTTTLCKYSWLP